MSGTPRYDGTVRILQLLRYLDGCRYQPSVARLADKFGVSERTMFRYLNVVQRIREDAKAWQ